jgi:hypothetical protein
MNFFKNAKEPKARSSNTLERAFCDPYIFYVKIVVQAIIFSHRSTPPTYPPLGSQNCPQQSPSKSDYYNTKTKKTSNQNRLLWQSGVRVCSYLNRTLTLTGVLFNGRAFPRHRQRTKAHVAFNPIRVIMATYCKSPSPINC